ncbi:light harvesting complex protein 10 precursor [Baffinella frigidus]|nr:light harvesting complex protein 10 precursor [Cryptophyta sp. CCMP2293]
MQAKSKAMPFLMAPPALDGSMAGDVGFDPLWVSSMLPDAGWLPWLREAEIKHGRVAMLAATGAIVQDLFQFKGTDTLTNGAKMTGLHDVFLAKELPGAAGNVATFHQMLLWLGILELASSAAIIQSFKGETPRVPGDYGFDPLKMGKDPKMALKEIKNGRLAMIGIGGMVHHYILTGKGPVEFFGGIPNYKSCVAHDPTLLPRLYQDVVGPVLPKIC